MKRPSYRREEQPQLGLGIIDEPEANAGVGDEHDFFPTPAWPTLAIWPHIYSPAVRIALDPCCGDGGILGALPAPLTLLGLEIDEERARRCEMRTNIRPQVCDALEAEWPICDLVIQNPPFQLAEAFVRKAIEQLAAGRVRVAVAVLLRLAFLESAERIALHHECPADVYVLANRPSFIDPQAWRPCPKCGGKAAILTSGCKSCNGRGEVKGGTDSTAYAWFCFGAGRGGRWTVLSEGAEKKRSRGGREDTRAARFWSHVERRGEDECWPWEAGRSSNGYGMIDHLGAHRVSWQIHNGTIPIGSMVLHRCDNPPCVNPKHLFLGTALDNMRDKIAKGRDTRGELVNTARLTAEQVVEIRAAAAAGETQTSIAERFGIGQPHVSSIVRGAAWKHVGGGA